MPAFANAICSMVSPSTAVCSSESDVITATSGAAITFVASKRPPRPVSSTTMPQPRFANQRNAMAVISSNSVSGKPAARQASASASTRSAREAKFPCGMGSPSTVMRSAKSVRCGDV